MKDGPVSITPEEANAKYTQADDGVFVDPEIPGGLVGREALSDYITRS